MIGKSKIQVVGQLVFPAMNFQIRGTIDIKEEIAEFEYKANCLDKLLK